MTACRQVFLSSIRPWLVTLSISIAPFIEVLDSTIVNVSRPQIAGDLSVPPVDADWVLTSYLAANAVAVALSAWLSNLLGRHHLFLGCMLVFGVSSALCGQASSLFELILFRVVQGLSGGGMVPVSQAILLDTFPREKLGMALSISSLVVVVAPIVGPVVGGWVTDNYSWRWVFYVGLPPTVLGFALLLAPGGSGLLAGKAGRTVARAAEYRLRGHRVGGTGSDVSGDPA